MEEEDPTVADILSRLPDGTTYVEEFLQCEFEPSEQNRILEQGQALLEDMPDPEKMSPEQRTICRHLLRLALGACEWMWFCDALAIEHPESSWTAEERAPVAERERKLREEVLPGCRRALAEFQAEENHPRETGSAPGNRETHRPEDA